ncbi:sulfurtransferase [uncultured Thermanaerothrix sp.]|uniref:sulfurtransferase n=1 Tax=uncultured Thermanaerothrix sp. TaxID=1195149 RepID=UPI002613E43E|nr:sulfurtransferase [uncultured Thermanaerothrix sp.]
MAYTTLISPHELSLHLHRSDWVIVDCRFDLIQPDWGFRSYQEGHIPGAVYADLDCDLSAPRTPQTGRHPLPTPAEFLERLQKWGIDPTKQVVVYDTVGGAFAARLWWMLRLYGHEVVAVLDGGFDHWVRLGYPIESGIHNNSPVAEFNAQPNFDAVATTAEIEQHLKHPRFLLIDARAPERYRGDVEPIDPIAGHIPGAVNRFHQNNLNPDGTFKSPEQLREEFIALLQGTPPENVVVYCGSGVTSCHHLLAMEIAGLRGARLYVGSWSEWIRDSSHPIATGNE